MVLMNEYLRRFDKASGLSSYPDDVDSVLHFHWQVSCSGLSSYPDDVDSQYQNPLIFQWVLSYHDRIIGHNLRKGRIGQEIFWWVASIFHSRK